MNRRLWHTPFSVLWKRNLDRRDQFSSSDFELIEEQPGGSWVEPKQSGSSCRIANAS